MDTVASIAHRIREALPSLPAASEQWVLGTSSKMANASALLALLSSLAPMMPAVNMTVSQPGVPIAPFPLPPPGSSSHGEEIIRQFVHLDRSTKWTLVEKVPFKGDTFEPEGIVRLGDDRYIVSAGEWIVPRSATTTGSDGSQTVAGAGFAHMIVFDGKGNQVVDATITAAGEPEYHGGGIDYDGTYIWATLAQYRPDSTATLVRLRPDTLQPEPILRIADHMGAVVHDVSTGSILTLNWGARSASLWDLHHKPNPLPTFTAPRAVLKNPSHYTDYQDCKFLGHSQRYGFRPVMLCSGITNLYGTTIGGAALVDMESMVPLYEVPLTMVSDRGTLVTKNPMDVALIDGKMRLFFLPDERNSTLYVYEPVLVAAG
ncbi:hypothetical protein NEMBOFW57_005218 [Staphylotrichum longicolle]|uniref:Uncharacterized protein n=1 Tax=Staphylotrichum longicolle TaxID=669026 RepID=A0AAD4HVV6_9PEZI|nr:hypothetical protein NEMBOFW57_005218 [Staphylotrichum longicolle]